MEATILKTLHQIEQTHNVKIIYAVESGSRAWGFASPDSDYDVRYIYVRRTEDYLRVDTLRDTIEGPMDEVLDFSGWDIRKTLELLRRTNPSLMEWYQSPIVYLSTPAWELLKAQIPACFDPRSNMHHYLSSAMGNLAKYMEKDQVKLKRYLYILRPLLCCRWLEKYGTLPPVPFRQLLEEVMPPELEAPIADLLRRKVAADESGLTAHIPELDDFIHSELQRLKAVRDAMSPSYPLDYEIFNRLFRTILTQAWD